MPKTYTLKWKNPVGKKWETIAEDLENAKDVFITIEKLKEMWKLPADSLERFYGRLKIIEFSDKGKTEITVKSLMQSKR